MRPTMQRAKLGGWLMVLLSQPLLAQVSDHQPMPQKDLGMMSIEDLMNIKVTSVSRMEERLSRTASAVFVITPEDIRDSGALNIPDLLRMVPGVEVAQIAANSWAIGIRGFNSRFDNKLLVLLDGRAAYTPTTGAVFWDVLDVPLEDIKRIEVIRGPGGSVWGANAVDGVINIITKEATETAGGFLTAGGGNLAQGFGTVQYGGSLDKAKHGYRVYAKYQNNDHLPNLAGMAGGDRWHLLTGGFRTDSDLSGKDSLSFQGNVYTGREGVPVFALQSVSPPVSAFSDAQVGLSGGYVQSVWKHTFSERAHSTFQISYDTYRRTDALGEGRKTFNADFQQHFRWADCQDILWGAEMRYTSSNSTGSLLVSLAPPAAEDYLFGSFVQDEITVVPNRLFLTLGTKVERSYYTGWAAMPSGRVAW